MIRREGVKCHFAVDFEAIGALEPESVFGHRRKANADWDFMIDPKSKIGYVRLSNFSRNTFRDLEDRLYGLRSQGMKGSSSTFAPIRGGLLDTPSK